MKLSPHLLLLLLIFPTSTIASKDALVVEEMMLGMSRAQVEAVFDHCSVRDHEEGIVVLEICGKDDKHSVEVGLDVNNDRVLWIGTWLYSSMQIDEFKSVLKSRYGNAEMVREGGGLWQSCYGDCVPVRYDDGIEGITIAANGKGLIAGYGGPEENPQSSLRLIDMAAYNGLKD